MNQTMTYSEFASFFIKKLSKPSIMQYAFHENET